MFFCVNRVKEELVEGGRTAGKKAPDDVVCIIKNTYSDSKVIEFAEGKKYKNTFIQGFSKLYINEKNWRSLKKLCKDGDVILLQHPYEGIQNVVKWIKRYKSKGVIFVALIHDLLSLRTNIESKAIITQKINFQKKEYLILKECDKVICHNEYMKDFMIQTGIDKHRLVCLGAFDYLNNCEILQNRTKSKSIIVAGNLQRSKCGYLYKLCEKEELPFQLHLYGPNYTENISRSFAIYHGQFSPEELPGKLEGSFGLVWDGTSIDSCAGNAGEYLRYNNPHKISLYLSSGIPVIIWKQAALAKFVEENRIGIVVDKLMDISDAIDRIDDEEYRKMQENAKEIGEKMRNGFFLKKALNEIGITI